MRHLWKIFEQRHAKAAKWIRQVFVYWLISMGVTVLQYLIFTFLPGWFGIKAAGTEWFLFPVNINLLGVSYRWSLLGAEVLRNEAGEVIIGGGLGYFIAYEIGTFIAQCINFPLQRRITYKSSGNILYQATWYFIAWVCLSIVCNGVNNLWTPIAASYAPPAVYNLLVTYITGGIAMIIFFFVFKVIFPEGKPAEKTSEEVDTLAG